MTREQIQQITKLHGEAWVEKHLPRVIAALCRQEQKGGTQ